MTSRASQRCWLEATSAEEQTREIDAGLDLLRQVGVNPDDWAMCYPYGAHNEALRTLLRQRGCRLGLTTEVAVADLRQHEPLALPRLDTNDLPRESRAKPDRWTRAVVARHVCGECGS